MTTTVFSTPLVTPCLRVISGLCLKVLGWTVLGKDIPSHSCVIAATPHTSNWDFPLMLLVVFHLKMRLNWMGKHTLFPPVFGSVMKWLGGIPIDRSKAGNVVSQTVARFAEDPNFVVLIPPEGTRRKAERWKTGFYHIAHQAKVPILMAAIDAEKKQLCFIGEFIPTGDIESDLPEIQQHLAGFKGIIPENAWDS